MPRNHRGAHPACKSPRASQKQIAHGGAGQAVDMGIAHSLLGAINGAACVAAVAPIGEGRGDFDVLDVLTQVEE